jgi:hypothetical protein
MTTTAGGGDGASADTATTLPNPFATPEQITERIRSELRTVITEAENNTTQGQHVEIKCDFGMSLEDMQCRYIPLLEAEGAATGATTEDGSTATTTTTNTTDTTGTGDDTTATISPLEGEE